MGQEYSEGAGDSVSVAGRSFDVLVSEADLPVLTNQMVISHDTDGMSQETAARVLELSMSVNLRDRSSIASFAAVPQRQMSNYLTTLMENVQTYEVGQAGALVAELATGMKGIDFKAMRSELQGGLVGQARKMLSKLPGVGKWVSHLERMKTMSSKVEDHLDTIESRAQGYMITLEASTAAMDKLFVSTEENLHNMAIYIKGGEMALQRMRLEFDEERQGVLTSKNVIRLTALRDMSEQINAFEVRLVRLHIAFNKGMQSLPNIRRTQTAGNIEYQNMLDTILLNIPGIKTAMLNIMVLQQISDASESSSATRRINRDLERIGQDMMEDVYTKAKLSQGDFLKDVDFLVEMSTRQAELGRKGATIDREAGIRRQQAMARIIEVRHNFSEDQREQAKISMDRN